MKFTTEKCIIIWIMLFCPMFSCLFSSPLSFEFLTKQKLDSNLNYLDEVKNAIVDVHIVAKGKGGLTFEMSQSGFFILPSLLMTSVPAEFPPEMKINCSDVQIRGYQEWAGLGPFGGVSRFNCANIALFDPEQGLLGIITEENSTATIPMIKEGELSFDRERSFSALGYSFHGRLVYSSRCDVKPRECENCSKFPVDSYAWSDAKCLHYGKMIGGPLLTRGAGAKVKVAGMLNSFLAPAGQDPTILDQIVVTKFPYQLKKVKFLSRLNEPAPTCVAVAENADIEIGDETAIRVQVKGQALTYSLDGQPSATVPSSKSFSVKVAPKKTREIEVVVKGLNGQDRCTAQVAVTYVPPPTCRILAPAVVGFGEYFKVEILGEGKLTKVQLESRGAVTVDRIQKNQVSYKFKAVSDLELEASVEGPSGKTFCSKHIVVDRGRVPSCSIEVKGGPFKKGGEATLEFKSTGTLNSWHYIFEDKYYDVSTKRSKYVVKHKVTQESVIKSEVIGAGGRTSCEAKVRFK